MGEGVIVIGVPTSVVFVPTMITLLSLSTNAVIHSPWPSDANWAPSLCAVVLTFVFRAMKTPDGVDQTEPSDYYADEGDPRVQPIDELTADKWKAST